MVGRITEVRKNYCSVWFDLNFQLLNQSNDIYHVVTLSLFTQVYKWVPAIIMLGGNLAMDYHPIQGGVAIFPVTSCYGNHSQAPA